MRNLAEPGPRFRAAAPNHPEALLEEPQAFQAVGEKNPYNMTSNLSRSCSVEAKLFSLSSVSSKPKPKIQ